MRAFAVAALVVSAVLVSAVPITEGISPESELGQFNGSVPTLGKRAATQVISQCTVPGQVALTFDDGPYQWEGKIRSDFGGGKGTFFMNGNNWGCIYDYADQLRDAYAAGWTIGSHGYSHAHMGQLTWDQAHDELWKVEEAMIKILGVKPLYFRPPYGEMSDTLLAVLENRGYKKAFMWSDDTGDTLGNSAQTINAQYDQIAKTYPQPHLILNHEVVQSTVDEVVPHAVSVLKNAGYQLVSVDTCLGSGGEWPYVWVGEPQQRDASWVCAPPLRN